MKNSNNSFIDPQTGDVTWSGTLSVEKGNHNNMPVRTEAYLPGDERGHVNASSLGGDNSKANIVPQHADVNHGVYYSMEQGERAALRDGSTIKSEKTAIVNSQPGDRPSTFIVNDLVTFADGHTEAIHLSFTNESNANQEAWNDASAALPNTFDAPNPGDALRSSMDTEAYASLMQETDASLPNLDAEYSAADFAGVPVSTSDASGILSDSGSNPATASSEYGANMSVDASGAEAGSGDGGASASAG